MGSHVLTLQQGPHSWRGGGRGPGVLAVPPRALLTLSSPPHSEEPLSLPAPSGSKRRRQLDSEDEDGDVGECSPLPRLWGGTFPPFCLFP